MSTFALCASIFTLAVSAATAGNDVGSLRTSIAGVRPQKDGLVRQLEIGDDWHDADTLVLHVRRGKASRQNAWVTVFFENSLFWRYQSPIIKLPKNGATAKIKLRFATGSADWYPAGHFRDLDSYALRHVTRIGVNFTSNTRFTGSVVISRAELLRRDKSKVRASLIFDLEPPAAGLVAGDSVEIKFRLDQPYRNPFDPSEADIRMRFAGPDRRKLEVPAYYTQAFSTGTGEPVGAGHWAVRIPALAPGAYTYRIVGSGRYRLISPEMSFVVKLRKAAPKSREAGPPIAGLAAEDVDRFQLAAWTYSRGAWKHDGADARAFPCLNARLQTVADNLGYTGVGRFDLKEAWLLEQKLARAANVTGDGKQTFSLRLFGNEEFHAASRNTRDPLRWKDNPYRKRNGGTIETPSEFFTDARARRYTESLLRYVFARYGSYRSVHGILLGADFHIRSGSAAWHRAVGTYWDELTTASGNSATRLISLHPQVADDAPPSLTPLERFVLEEPAGAGAALTFSGSPLMDWTGAEALQLDLIVQQDAANDIHLAVAFRDWADRWYRAEPQGFLRAGDWNRVVIALGAGSLVKPVGHTTPWSPSLLNEIRDARVHIFSDSHLDGKVDIEKIGLASGFTGSDQTYFPRVTQWRDPKLKPAAEEVIDVGFRLSRYFSNPYDPREIAIDAHVTGPKGQTRIVPAFFYVPCRLSKDDGNSKVIPDGEPEWRLRIRFAEPGNYRYRLFARTPDNEPQVITTGTWTVDKAREPEGAPKTGHEPELSAAAESVLLRELDRTYSSMFKLKDREWRPFTVASNGRGTAAAGSGAAGWADAVWRVNLEWSKKWRQGYMGLSRYNPIMAWTLDRVLAESETKGFAVPLRITGNEEFHDVSSHVAFPYRWLENPLNAANHGPLDRASDYFSDAAAKANLDARIRYIVARYGAYRSVAGLVFANDMPSKNANQWHRELALRLEDMALPEAWEVVSFHPQAADLSKRTWRRAQPLRTVKGPSTAAVHALANGIKGHEIQALASPGSVLENWQRATRMDIAIELPKDAPDDIRVMLCIKNEDDWWYQTMHPAFLRPGDVNSLLFDLTSDGPLMPVGHRMPWTEFTRCRVKDLTLRFFSLKKLATPINTVSVSFVDQARDIPGPLTVTAIRELKSSVNVDTIFELEVDLNRTFRDPFDLSLIQVFADIASPSGGVRRVNAFFNQNFELIRGAPAPVGAPHWKLRVQAREMGRHTYRLHIKVNGKMVKLPEADGAFKVIRRRAASVTPSDPATSTLRLKIHDLSYRTVSVLTQGQWRQRRHSTSPYNDKPAWQPVLEWSRRWRHYHNLGHYNLEAAWLFDQALDAAVAAGESFPMRLNGVMEFHNRRTYRWPHNPLNEVNGGPLTAPSQYFTDAAARKSQIALWTYLIARYGEFRAVDGYVLANDIPSEGAEIWHDDVGRKLGAILPPWQTLTSLHPQSVPHLRAKMFADFEPGPMAPVRKSNGFNGAPSGSDSNGDDADPKKLRENRSGGKPIVIAPMEPQTVPVRFKPAPAIPGGKETRVGMNQAWATHGGRSLEIRRNYTGEGEAPVVAVIDQDWFDYDTLMLDVKLPKGAPENMRLMVFLKDGDFWYYQNLLKPYLIPGDVTRFIVDITATNGDWTPPPEPAKKTSDNQWIHTKPWSDYVRTRVRQVGLRVFGHQAYNGPIGIDNLQLWKTGGRDLPGATPRITKMTVKRDDVPVYDQFELAFELDRDFHNPFDPDEANVLLHITQPGRRVQIVPAYYFQDYTRTEVSQFCRTHKAKEPFEVLTPVGKAHWRARYTPVLKGVHRWRITINDQPVDIPGQSHTFTASAAGSPGFIRVASDDRHFEHADGTFYYPIGHNLRSPTDTRNTKAYQGRFKQEWHRGTYAYDDYFASMKKAELNWARVWQCSWWLGLEWNRNWNGFHGVGRYNLENAWRLDYLLRRAREAGVYLQIDTTNHGQLSLKIDTEWALNPYNRALRKGGGTLRRPRDFFALASARKQYAKRVRYTAARWGSDPNIFGWILLTESEFTDDYWQTAYKQDEAGRHPKLVEWHRFAAREFKRWDPHHMTAAHFSHPFRGADVFAVPEVAFVESNAYWQDWKYQALGGPAKDTVWINKYIFKKYLGIHSKPVIMGEFGGGVFVNTPQGLDTELHIGSWSMAVLPYAGATGYWWWPWLHYMDRYAALTNVARFMKDNDRRGLAILPIKCAATNGLKVVGITGNRTQADIWVYHRLIKSTDPMKLPIIQGAGLTLSKMKRGTYNVEFWDTYKGKPVKTITVQLVDGKLQIPLPKFRADLALKVRRK